MRQLKILIVLPFPPRLNGLHGGARVTAWTAAALAKRHQVGIIYLQAAGEEPIDRELEQSCAFAQSVRYEGGHSPSVRFEGEHSYRAKLWRRLAAGWGLPLWVRCTWSPIVAQKIKQIAQAWKPDVVHLDFHILGQYRSAASAAGARLILTEHEPGITAAREHVGTQRQTSRFRSWWIEAGWRRFERSVIAGVDAVVVFADRDAMVLRNLGAITPIECIRFRVPVPVTASDGPEDAVNSTLLFIGNFIHPPNIDAAERLVRHIYPAVQAKIPNVSLIVVGPNPPPSLIVANGGGVQITGQVDEPATYLARALIYVAPLRHGGGVRVKILEACAAGKAIVASARSTQGLSLQEGVDFLRAESDAEFVDTVVGLLKDPLRAKALGQAARSWALKSQNVDEWISEYEALYERLGLTTRVIASVP
jgi:glycosyltransferase involved in cell wall biosynthesis